MNGSKIQAAPNGPYLVHNSPPLKNSKGGDLETRDVTALCRCGKSDNKPYCDGTHAKVGFSSEREADGSNDKWDVYAGKAITLHDNRGVCAHSAICTGGLSSVFKYGEEPWIDADGADVAAIEKQVAACPSGALKYTAGGTEHGDFGNDPLIYVAKNGPYAVKGGVEFEDSVTGQVPKSRDHYTLCRCGGSKNKPFCDGTHLAGLHRREKLAPNKLLFPIPPLPPAGAGPDPPSLTKLRRVRRSLGGGGSEGVRVKSADLRLRAPPRSAADGAAQAG